MDSEFTDYKTHVESLAGAKSVGGPLRSYHGVTKTIQEMEKRAEARRDKLINDTLAALHRPDLAKTEKLSRIAGLTSREEMRLLLSEKEKFVEAMRKLDFLKPEILKALWQVDPESPAYEEANKEYERIESRVERHSS
jgi:hypothetical protein